MPSSEAEFNPQEHLQKYLLDNAKVFRELYELKILGWSHKDGDTFFQSRREAAYNTTAVSRKNLYKMTCSIGSEMAIKTNAFTFDEKEPRILDLCMAPGSFTDTAIQQSPNAAVDAITLPLEQGGHEVQVERKNLNIFYGDVTIFGAELGATEVPRDHPDATRLTAVFPFEENSYDTVICGGAMLRNQQFAEFRTGLDEEIRLQTSQLVIALQRLKRNGTMILLLHRPEKWSTFSILRMFNRFSRIELFKPRKAHAIKSSFYLIAKDVDTYHPEAINALEIWKNLWYKSTIGTWTKAWSNATSHLVNQDEAIAAIEDFGPRLIQLSKQVWQIQARALQRSPFMQKK